MCAIFGATVVNASGLLLVEAESHLSHVFERSFERGRDGRGYASLDDRRIVRTVVETDRATSWKNRQPLFKGFGKNYTTIGNCRAEPTTEFVSAKRDSDQQPYRVGEWTIVHNGTIANDGELRTWEVKTTIDSAAIVELLAEADMPERDPKVSNLEHMGEHFARCVEKLKGSYAILAMHSDFPGCIFAACNYRPIWMAEDSSLNIRLFASSENYFPDNMIPVMLEPYSTWMFGLNEVKQLRAQPEFVRKPFKPRPRALVVCSGGLDSVVAATEVKRQGMDVTLLHFRYGSRAEEPEVRAVEAVAKELGVGYWMPTMDIYDPKDSPLLQKDSAIAGGEAGAEFAHEWVPARNLVMLSIATAMAEAKGFDYIVLGNNLEEAGAYPDNEPEFINRFNALLPFAVGDGKRVRVLMPVGNMMKHEIVEHGLKIGAPLHLTWSCYRAGEKHCGRCGPCYMRKTAFRINNRPEVIKYEEN